MLGKVQLSPFFYLIPKPEEARKVKAESSKKGYSKLCTGPEYQKANATTEQD